LARVDENVAAINAHENIEVRVFNPTYYRGFAKYFEMAFRSKSVGRRMHNKTFNVDNNAVILGGRNLGNIYFGASKDHVYIDSDILGIGPIASEVTYEFETYWHSEIVYRFEQIHVASQKELTHYRKKYEDFLREHRKSPYWKWIKETTFAQEFQNHQLELIFSDATVLYDPPTKVSRGIDTNSTYLMQQLKPYLAKATSSLTIVNPYFVPSPELMSFFKILIDKGVKIKVWTCGRRKLLSLRFIRKRKRL